MTSNSTSNVTSNPIETILDKKNEKLSVFPVQYNGVWNMYKQQQSAFWLAAEIDFSKDYDDYLKLDDNEKYFIKMILSFFLVADTLVNVNLSECFINEIKILEIVNTYIWQRAVEVIHCCSADTLILTDKGYYFISDKVDTDVNVWNGSEFSSVRVKYTGDQCLTKVILSNGMELECTLEHKWYIKNNFIAGSNEEIITTKNLSIGMIISEYNLPIIEMEDPYNFTNPSYHAYFHDSIEKDSCKPKYFVPINYSIIIRLKWITGLLKRSFYKNNMTILYSPNHKFLLNIQILFTTLKLFVSVEKKEKESCLFIRNNEYDKLIKLIDSYNIDYNDEDIKNLDYYDNDNDSIISIKSIGKVSNKKYPTYCFTEKKKGKAIFNGILTGQSETYSLQVDNLIKDSVEKEEVFDAIKNFSCIKNKISWINKWIETGGSEGCEDRSRPPSSIQRKLVAFVIVEGLFFSGSFCSIFWFKKRGLMPGLCKSNEFISRDEGLHTNFGAHVYSLLDYKLDQKEVHNIFIEGVKIEEEFITSILPCDLLGMNSNLMIQYIKFVADDLMLKLGYEKYYMVSNPFDFMERIGMEGKTNFFESRPTEYQNPCINNKTLNSEFKFDDEF